MKANKTVDLVPAVNHYGEFTSRLLQHDEWRRESLRAAQERAVFRAMRHDQDRFEEAGQPGALALLRGLLARAGQRLQGRRQLTAVAR